MAQPRRMWRRLIIMRLLDRINLYYARLLTYVLSDSHSDMMNM